MDLKKGIINFNNKIAKLHPKLKRQDFVDSDLKEEILSEDIDVYSSYYLKPQIIVNNYFVIRVYFGPEDIIESVAMSITKEGSVPNWNDYSEQYNIELKEMHDKWLSECLGQPPYSFDWGEISSVYDKISGSSFVLIEYK